MKPMIYFWTAILLLPFCSLAQSHKEATGTLSGTVQTADGTPVADATVLLKGTAKGTVTNESGQFVLRRLSPGQYLLQVSGVGFSPLETTATIAAGTGNPPVVIRLQASARELTGVVVTGSTKYRTGNVSPTLRLQTPILELPQNIQVITRGLMADQQSFDMLEGVQRNVSGAQKVEHWDNYARINMRGTQLTAFRNGMNVQMPWGPLAEDLSMVERVEFVKGPAGFMLANGEPSGLYNVVTKKPTGATRGEASFTLGSFNLYRATTDVEGLLSDDGRLRYRLNLMGQLKGSHRDFEYNNRYTFVPVLQYEADERTTLTLEYTHQFSEMSVIGSNYSFSPKGYATLPRSFTTAEPNLDPSRIRDNSLLVQLEHRFSEAWKLTAQGAYFHYNMIGQSIWPWTVGEGNDSLMQRGISIWDALAQNRTAQVFLNGEFRTRGLNHRVLAGIDQGKKEYYADWNQGAALGGAGFNIYKPAYGTVPVADVPVWDRSRDIRERGVFYGNSYTSFYVQDEIGLFRNRLRLTLAGRYTSNKDQNPYDGTADQQRFTPRGGLSFSFDKATTAYFLYDQAFIANYGADWQGRSFDPVTGDNFELGIKRDWAEGRWNSALSVYRIERNNVLTTDLEHPHPVTGQYVFSRPTGQQCTKGVELDIKGQLTRNLEGVVNYAFTEAKVTRDTDEKRVGNPVPGATRHLQNTWLTYAVRSGALQGFKVSLGYQYAAGRSSWFIFDDSEGALPEYFRLDGAVSYHTGKLGLYLNVN
ncbi:MAG TPA: TonB-dependent siderophore receptor, partial [Chitinophagaceae bacterium]|nr:TonB-dependent siderophore receptor [Chitinophagaceae bacterium]